jgi:formamidopyrimidine-DNA glycosylase
MPELPEAERARLTLESVLGRRVAAVDDTDTYVCRPHQPGEIAAALVGHEFTSAQRRGKFLWMETQDGPTLGLHLGMAGRIALEAPEDKPIWDRFTVEFDDGTRFALRDRRRLGRALLNPDFAHVGRTRRSWGARSSAGASAAAGAREGPAARPGRDLGRRQPARRRGAVARPAGAPARDGRALHRGARPPAPRRAGATRDAIRDGGVHTGTFVAARGREGVCPRCGHALSRATVGGRTTYWCPECQL